MPCSHLLSKSQFFSVALLIISMLCVNIVIEIRLTPENGDFDCNCELGFTQNNDILFSYDKVLDIRFQVHWKIKYQENLSIELMLALTF